MEGVTDIKKINHWLEEAGLEDSTEALIMSWRRAGTYNQINTGQGLHHTAPHRCRLCSNALKQSSMTDAHMMLACISYVECCNLAGIM